MENLDVVIYESFGENTFVIPFEYDILKEVNIFVDNVEKQRDIDYTIEKQNVIFKYNVGDNLVSKNVVISKNKELQRKTEIINNSTINYQILNHEFNNIYDCLNNLDAKIKNMVNKQYDDYFVNMMMPKPKEGSAIYFGKNGELLTTTENIEQILNDMQLIIDVSLGESITANSIFYDNSQTLLDANNTQKAIDLLVNSINIKYENSEMLVENVKSGIDYIYQYSKNNINDLQDYKTSCYFGSPLTVLSGRIDANNGFSNVIEYLSENNQIKICCSERALILGFSIENVTKKIIVNNDCFINVEKNKILYVYAEVNGGGFVEFKTTEYPPFYVYYKISDSVNNSSCLIDKYTNFSDYFYIPTKTMYDFNHTIVQKVYLGKIKINDDGTVAMLVNYSFGDIYFEDFNCSINSTYNLPNRFGTSMVDVSVYYMNSNTVNEVKANSFYPSQQFLLYDIGKLNNGITYSFNANEIIVKSGKVGVVFVSEPLAFTTTNVGVYRVIVRRLF